MPASRFSFLVYGLLCGPVFMPAVAMADSTAEAEFSEQDKRDFVNHMAQDAISILYDHKRSFSTRKKTLENAFKTVVDIEWIARFVLGRNWQAATEEQRERYVELYRRYLTQTYISNFSGDSDYKVRDIKVRHVGRTENEKFAVKTVMQLAGGQSVKVDYVVRDKNNRYKVIDIAIEGISLLTSHRTQMAQVASAKGVEGVIHQLEQMTQSPSYAMLQVSPSAGMRK